MAKKSESVGKFEVWGVDVRDVWGEEAARAFSEQVRAFFRQLEQEGYFDAKAQDSVAKVVPFPRRRDRRPK